MARGRSIVHALVLVVVPIAFVWHAELVLVYPAESTTLTNGFATYDGGVVYHSLMYVLFGVNFVSAALLLRSEQESDSATPDDRTNE